MSFLKNFFFRVKHIFSKSNLYTPERHAHCTARYLDPRYKVMGLHCGAAGASWGLHDRLTGQLCDVITNTSRADHVPLMIRKVGSMAENDNTCVNCTELNRLK